MQPRRHEDQQPGQRRVMPSEQFSRVIAPGGTPRFDNNDNAIPANLAYPIAGYGQMTQPPQHLQPQQSVHPTVGAAALSAVHQGGVAPSPSVHPPPTLQAGAAAPPPVNQMAQVPQGGLGAPPPGPQQQQQFQRLKVEDALSYLDQVKLQFGNQPSVYNDFLDIMKEFKSQTIDTPGVINRVSNLFKGHPDLIVGFNTFLPPGYKIEVERDVINVYQPGQASMPISALNAGASASAAIGLQSQPQKSPAHIPSVAPPLSQQAPPPAIHHTYTQPPRPAHPDVPPLPLPHHSQPPSAASTSPQGGNQPVEFNHAINYVNKIKNRFQGQPEVYKQFLEILHTYQKEQRHIKEGLGGAAAGQNKPLTETEVYAQVAKLFVDQEDLLSEFGQFLPDANGGGGGASLSDMALGVRNDHSSTVKKPGFTSKALPGKASSQLKRPPSLGGSGLQPPSKKYKTGVLKDVSMAEAGKYASLKEYAFFDQVRVALRSNEVYNNFLRCLILFNSEVISRSELINMVHPFLGKYPELYKWFKEFLGHKESGNASEALPQGTAKERSVRDEYNMEIDFQSCKQYGASYRALPSSYPQPKCSGRTQLCREVLNDTWVSIPTWSEDSTFVTSRKSQFEEYIYKCEDERFELDVVLEMNFATIKTLEAVQRKMQRMTTEEAAKFRLDNTLGGSSEFVAKRAICRIYGEKSTDIIDGLKKNPVVAVPLVLRRLKAKDEEWREAQKSFNKVWREQNEKYYLKSLDHQGMTFKQNDIKALRGKSLVNEIETILEEQNEANQQGQSAEVTEPHIKETYEDKSVFDDAASIIIHNMKRQSNMHHEDKKKIKQLMYHFVRDLLFYPRGELSDDEDEDTDGDGGDKRPKDTATSDAVRGTTVKEEKDGWGESRQNGHDTDMTTTATNNNNTTSSADRPAAAGKTSQQTNGDSAELDLADEEDADDRYTLFYGNTQWYLFFRLHFKLCQRLLHFRRMSDKIAQQEENSKADRKPSTALALRLRTTFDVEPKDYYNFFLESIKNLMDCSIESGMYEDTLREMYGINSYLGFTMDKQVVQIVRNLHHLVTEESSTEMTELFLEEKQNQATGGPLSTRSLRQQAELNYQRRAENVMADDNCFKFVFYKKSGEVHITLLDQGGDQGEEVGETERWAAYVERYVSMAPTDPSQHFSQKMVKLLCDKPVFLSRNIASWRRRNLCGHREEEDDEEDMEEEEDRASEEEKEKKDDDTHSEDAMCGDRPKKSANQNMLNFHLMECVKDVNDGKTMIADGAGVRFTINSLKMQHICWGAEMWYRRSALHNARKSHRQVSLTKHDKLWRWLEAWRKEKVTSDDEQDCEDWMMGRGDNILPSTSTWLTEVDNPNKPPYYPYHRYRVKRRTPSPAPVPASVPAPTPTPTSSSVSPTPPPSSSSSSATAPLPSAPTVTSALPLDLQPGGRPSSRPSSRPSTPAE